MRDKKNKSAEKEEMLAKNMVQGSNKILRKIVAV
jgi:hypothetical protein